MGYQIEYCETLQDFDVPDHSYFNFSFRDGFIPAVWKHADVVPLPNVTPGQN